MPTSSMARKASDAKCSPSASPNSCCGKQPITTNNFPEEYLSHNELLASARAASGKPSTPSDSSWHDACNQCEACHLALADTHPDIHIIHRQLIKYHDDSTVRNRKGLDLGVDVIRQFVIDAAAIKPAMGQRKIFIIREADLLTTSAQNALLKTIEEPPPTHLPHPHRALARATAAHHPLPLPAHQPEPAAVTFHRPANQIATPGPARRPGSLLRPPRTRLARHRPAAHRRRPGRYQRPTGRKPHLGRPDRIHAAGKNGSRKQAGNSARKSDKREPDATEADSARRALSILLSRRRHILSRPAFYLL